MACEIFPDQGSNPCPPHWQADSEPLDHQGSPQIPFGISNFVSFRWILRSGIAEPYVVTSSLHRMGWGGQRRWDQKEEAPEMQSWGHVCLQLSLRCPLWTRHFTGGELEVSLQCPQLGSSAIEGWYSDQLRSWQGTQSGQCPCPWLGVGEKSTPKDHCQARCSRRRWRRGLAGGVGAHADNKQPLPDSHALPSSLYWSWCWSSPDGL